MQMLRAMVNYWKISCMSGSVTIPELSRAVMLAMTTPTGFALPAIAAACPDACNRRLH